VGAGVPQYATPNKNSSSERSVRRIWAPGEQGRRQVTEEDRMDLPLNSPVHSDSGRLTENIRRAGVSRNGIVTGCGGCAEGAAGSRSAAGGPSGLRDLPVAGISVGSQGSGGLRWREFRWVLRAPGPAGGGGLGGLRPPRSTFPSLAWPWESVLAISTARPASARAPSRSPALSFTYSTFALHVLGVPAAEWAMKGKLGKTHPPRRRSRHLAATPWTLSCPP